MSPLCSIIIGKLVVIATAMQAQLPPEDADELRSSVTLAVEDLVL